MLKSAPPALTMAPFSVPAMPTGVTAGVPDALQGYLASYYKSSHVSPSGQITPSSLNAPNPWYNQQQQQQRQIQSPGNAALIQALMARR